MKYCRVLFRFSLLLALLSSVFTAPVLAATPYVLIAWNDLGMHCTDGSDFSVSTILPPYNNLHAQLKDRAGNLVTNPAGITVTYQAMADPAGSVNATSIGKTNFWDYAGTIFGSSPAPDVGLAGKAMPGLQNVPQPMDWDPSHSWFHAEGIPITPYDDQGRKNYYPMMRVIARDAQGNVLGQTDVVVPVSDEMDCRTCHQSGSGPAAMPPGGWVYDGNQARDVKYNILKLHDAMQAADPAFQSALAAAGFDPKGLYATVKAGRPFLCQRCHATNALAGTGVAGVHPMTQAMHTLHSTVTDPATGLPLGAAANRNACYRCHPGSTTQCLRGAMGSAAAPDGSREMQCQGCHGTMSAVGTAGRQGWLQEPACQYCHTGTAVQNSGQIRYTTTLDASGQLRQPANQTFATQADTPSAGFNLYRFSTGHGSLQCEACHGPTHAEYPTNHANDNIQSTQIQGHAGTLSECSACHTTVPTTVTGGPHGMHPVGATWVSRHSNAAEGGASACKACHGTDYRGTVLSRSLADRTLSTSFGTKTFWRGFQVGCYTCHNGPSSESGNSNHAPTVSSASAATSGGAPVSVPVTAADADGNTLTLRVVSAPSHGTAGFAGRTATYYPDPEFVGTDTFTVAAWDGSTDSNLATVTVTVNPPGCGLSCAAQVPASGPAGQSLPFAAQAAITNCLSAPTYEWDFGDGAPHAFAPAPTHAYTSADSYGWILTARSGSASVARQGTITITGGSPRPVPDSVVPTLVTPLTGGSTLRVTWDATNCSSPNYHLIYGYGSSLPSWTVAGGQCGLGTSGSALWTGAPDPGADPSRFVWFLIAADDGAGTEGSWGLTSSGQERGGAQPSGACGFTAKASGIACAMP